MDQSRPLSSLLVAALLAATALPGAWAQVAPPTAAMPSLGDADDRFMVRLTPAASRAAFLPPDSGPAARARLGLPAIDRALATWPGAWLEPEFRGDRPPAPGSPETDFAAFYVVHLPPGVSRDDALRRVRALSDVADAHAIGFAPVAAVPNDSLWSVAYYFYQPSRRDIHAPEAWDLTKGDTAISVAIIDTGVLPYHPDLGGTVAGGSGQMWTNWAEVNGLPGVDDDHNGFVDDVHGWDFVNLFNGVDAVPGEDWQDQDNDPNDYIGHGTCVAGLIGALSDNQIGVTGTAWNVRLMPLRVAWSSPRQQTGIVDMSYVTSAIRYATRMRANVINISLSNTPTGELDLAVRAALDSGIVVVIAAGNNGTPNYIGDAFPDAIVVAATDADDVIPIWSNRGRAVDLAAPGVNLATTITSRPGADSLGLRAPSYVSDLAGTSFCTPIVSGAVALVEAIRKQNGLEPLTPRQMGIVLRYTSDDISTQNPGVTGYGAGRLDLARALTSASRFRNARVGMQLAGSGVAFRTNRGDSLLAFPSQDGRLAFFDARSFAFVRSSLLGGVAAGALAAADLGSGRGMGIFVSLGDRVDGFGGAGAPLPGWPVAVPYGDLVGSPVLGDLDGDGSLEIVGAGTGGRIWAWTSTGTLVPGFPLRPVPTVDVYAPLALSDLDGQPGVEIIAAQTNGRIHAFRWNGSELTGWPVSTNDPLPAGPVVGALAGQPIVVVSATSAVHRIASDGSPLPQTARIALEVSADPGLGDLTHSGVDDILVAGPSGIQALALGSDSQRIGWPVLWSGPTVGAPLVGYFTSSDTQAVILPVGAQLRGLGATGGALPDFLPYPDGNPYVSLLAIESADSVRLIQGTSSDSILYSYVSRSAGHPGASSSWPTERGGFARTGSRVYQPAMGEADVIPPMAIGDLQARAVADSSQNVLTWTAPDDVGAAGKAAEYEVRAATAPGDFANHLYLTRRLTSTAAQTAAGSPDSLHVTSLGDADRYFAIRSRDASGNWSDFSSPVARQYPPPNPPPPPPPIPETNSLALALGRNPSSLPLPISWQSPSAAGRRELRIMDIGGRLVRSIDLGAGRKGSLYWDGRDGGGAISPSGVYVATLILGADRVTKRFVLLQ